MKNLSAADVAKYTAELTSWYEKRDTADAAAMWATVENETDYTL